MEPFEIGPYLDAIRDVFGIDVDYAQLTNGFSKKFENHANAVALHFAYHNLVKAHNTVRMTPAIAGRVTDRLWEMSDLIAVLEATEQAAGGIPPF